MTRYEPVVCDHIDTAFHTLHQGCYDPLVGETVENHHIFNEEPNKIN